MRRRLASRRSRSGSLGDSSRPPSTDTLTSTTGSNVCGLSYSSGAASLSSCGVATPQRWRQASPRRAFDFISTRITSFTWKQSVKMLAGEAYGSVCAWTGSCASSALDSNTLSARKAPSEALAHTLRKLGANALAGVEHRAADNDACGQHDERAHEPRERERQRAVVGAARDVVSRDVLNALFAHALDVESVQKL